MVDVQTIVISVTVVLSVFLQPGIKSQPTIGCSSEDDSCSQQETEWKYQIEESMHLRRVLDSERQRISTLKDVSDSQSDEIQLLKVDLENIRRRQRARQSQPATSTFIGRVQTGRFLSGITKVGDRIYVLGEDPGIINVFEDRNDFRFIQGIALNETRYPYDIVYSNKSKCVYISDPIHNCVWMMSTTDELRLTKWLTGLSGITTLSLSNDSQLLVLRESESFNQVETYSWDSTLVSRLLLSEDIKAPKHVVQTSDGNFILLHRLNNASSELWVISKVTNDGQLVIRFIPRNQCEKLDDPRHLSLDSDNNRLFVADYSGNRVILFDSIFLIWRQVIVSIEMNGIPSPLRLFYDSGKKQLLVEQYLANATVFEIK